MRRKTRSMATATLCVVTSPRELYDQMTGEQRKSFAILGNMKPILPKQQQVNATTSMDSPEDQPQDDLPF